MTIFLPDWLTTLTGGCITLKSAERKGIIMKNSVICFAIGALFGLCGTARAATAVTVAPDYCHAFAESWYQQAIALGSDSPDGAYEQAMADCELQMWGRSQVLVKPEAVEDTGMCLPCQGCPDLFGDECDEATFP